MKEIKGYESLYAVDRVGDVWSLIQTTSRRKGKLKPYVNAGGYLRVNLYSIDGRVKKYYVHRLVAGAYLPNPHNFPAVNHISANKKNNTPENLEWCNAKYNIAESRRLGLQKDKKVRATSIFTADIKTYESLKAAALEITGHTWGFMYLRKKCGNSFFFKEWRIEVMPL